MVVKELLEDEIAQLAEAKDAVQAQVMATQAVYQRFGAVADIVIRRAFQLEGPYDVTDFEISEDNKFIVKVDKQRVV